MASPPSSAVIDLDDADALLAADRDGLLRAAAMAGAQVRATAAALDEGLLESLRSPQPPRTVIWVAGRGTAQTAGAVLAAAFGASIAAPIVVVAEAPPWVGALDVMIVAGDDPGEPLLVTAAATAVRRGARVIIAAPYEGPLRDATAGRAVALAPRVWVPDDFGLVRYLAAGLAVLQVVDPGLRVDLGELADELDAEALRNSPGRDLFTNPAKALAERITGRDVVLAGDEAATLALARHGAAVLLRVAQETVAAVGLPDVLVALRAGFGRSGSTGSDAGYAPSIFHDEELDGPLPRRVRTLVLTTGRDRADVAARVSGYDDLEVVDPDDVPEAVNAGPPAPGAGRLEQQLAKLAVRLEMTAVYLRLVRG
ncbi:TobH protein [Mycolicibacterium sp. S2-37]|uniref:TobH protein n=1 Tax=Mycolicibacterium sp. S2-37 TaxID=2810297 RepID=UPI001A953CDE|nr:TobH protein [Mycolicibacterium sp. S2-37]MBO0677681.1 TobH protein [Mycolicibacterium sp. S2-37]